MQGTQNLLELAASIGDLQSFLHVSTAFVNVNQPAGAVVEEVLYPLPPLLQGMGPTAHDTAAHLSSLKPDAANAQVLHPRLNASRVMLLLHVPG